MPRSATPARFFSAIISTTTRAVGRIERGRRLVEQQHRMIGDEAARDIDALLLAAREGRGRQGPQPLRQIEPREQRACPVARASPRRRRGSTSGSATTSSVATRGTVRRNWLT